MVMASLLSELLLLSLSFFSILLTTQALNATTMNAHLTAGARLLGKYNPPTSVNLSSWMSAYNDTTPIQSLNIPGTHDSLTCEFGLCNSCCIICPTDFFWLTGNVPIYVAPFVTTQDFSLFDQLNNGVRFVDLRIGILQGSIRLYHGTASIARLMMYSVLIGRVFIGSYLLDSSVEIEDVFWGLYYWLDMHPTETVLVSMKVDNGNNTAALQQQLYNLMTNVEISNYWVRNSTVSNVLFLRSDDLCGC
jgi:1-phosphatidylinositol phosphodiesterase